MTHEQIDVAIHADAASSHRRPACGRSLSFTVICIITILPAICAAGVPGSGYIAAGVGNSWSTFVADSVKFDVQDIKPTIAVWRLFAGYQVNDYLGIEGGYVHLGKARLTEASRKDYYEAKVTGFDLTPIGFFPFGRHLSVFARLGYVFWSSDIKFNYEIEGSGAKDESGSSLAMGLGVKYNLNRYLGLRAEYTRYAIDKAKAGLGDWNLLMINGIFAFGRQ